MSKRMDTLRRRLPHIVAIGIGSALLWSMWTFEQPQKKKTGRANLAEIVNKSETKINQLLKKPLNTQEYRWKQLPDSFAYLAVAFPEDSTIFVKQDRNGNLSKQTTNDYATKILHEHAHIYFNTLPRHIQQEFSTTVKKQVMKYGTLREQEQKMSEELMKYQRTHALIHQYKEEYQEQFEKDYWGSEVFAQFAGFAQEAALNNTQVQEVIPEELAQFYTGYIKQEHLPFRETSTSDNTRFPGKRPIKN